MTHLLDYSTAVLLLTYWIVNPSSLVARPPALVTAIGPLVAPAATVASMKLRLSTSNLAFAPLNVTAQARLLKVALSGGLHEFAEIGNAEVVLTMKQISARKALKSSGPCKKIAKVKAIFAM